MNSTKTFSIAVVLGVGLISGASLADGGADDQPSNVVSFADLNLNTAAGVATLYRRIENTADRVCELPRETHQLRITMELKACKAGATERAVRLVNLPALNALHFAKSGQTISSPQLAKTK